MATLPVPFIPSANCPIAEFTAGKWDGAGAQAFMACKHFEAIDKQTFGNWIIAGIQSFTQFHFADLQHEIAKQAQDRLDRITVEQLQNSANLRGQYEHIMGCERAMATEACDVSVPLPDYVAVLARVRAPIIAQFTRLRKRLQLCAAAHCQDWLCSEERKLQVEQAKQLARAEEAAYRREEALHEQRKAAKRAERFQIAQHMRGHAQAASAALAGAAQTASAAAGINPYSGWIQAVNGIAGRATGLLGQQTGASAFAAMNGRVAGGAGSIAERGVMRTDLTSNWTSSEVKANELLNNDNDIYSQFQQPAPINGLVGLNSDPSNSTDGEGNFVNGLF